MSKKGLLFVVSGPSGCGKGTVLSEVLKNDKNIKYSISATTRKPREGEKNGVNYYFLTNDKFDELILENGFLEYAKYVENSYGTLKKPIDDWLDNGFDVILEIEIQGALLIKKKCKDAIFIFVAPPSLEELKNRLLKRKTEDIETINKRLMVAAKEIEYINEYEYIVINDSINNAIEKLSSIIISERCKIKSYQKNHDTLL